MIAAVVLDVHGVVARRSVPVFVMPGLVPGIHLFALSSMTWMAGTSPAMTTAPPSSSLRSIVTGSGINSRSNDAGGAV
jgi:hypothetical protein